MSLTLGEKLQQAREARGISISEVAENTRISPLYLAAIENNDYRTLPGGIFNKGFLKTYAKYVGVDEQEALQDYSTLISRQEAVSEDPQTYRPEVLTDDNTNYSSVGTIVFAVVILGLMIGGILVGLNYWKSSSTTEPIVSKQTANTAANQSNAVNAVNAANTNSAVAVGTPAIVSPTDEIKVEFKSAEKVSVEATIDGKKASKEIAPDAAENYTAKETLKFRYYRGFADKIQLTVNGKTVTPPPAPAKGNGVEFEINKSNIAQILQSGQIAAVGALPAVPR